MGAVSKTIRRFILGHKADSASYISFLKKRRAGWKRR